MLNDQACCVNQYFSVWPPCLTTIKHIRWVGTCLIEHQTFIQHLPTFLLWSCWICEFIFLWPVSTDMLHARANWLFFDIFKFSLKGWFWGQRQRKVDDTPLFFKFIPCFYFYFLSSLPHYQAEYLISKMACCYCKWGGFHRHRFVRRQC